MSKIAEAKVRLPLPELMSRCGVGDRAKKSARCPFHDDHHNSFSVWQNGDGWRFKCHAGCGHGDEINFLELHESLSRKDATKRFVQMAGVNGAPRRPIPTFDWQRSVAAFGDKHLKRLSDWRGYSPDFCSWLKESGLVGIVEGCIAFPVMDNGKVVAAHVRQKDGSWRYVPKGAKMHPLVIGELVSGDHIHFFESQWDGFSFMDKSGERSGVVITRGASNGSRVADVIPQGANIYLWTQNDAPGQKWERDICANAKATAKRVKVPAQHEDLNDWTNAGATADDLLAAMVHAEVIRGTETSNGESPTPIETTTPEQPFPTHYLPPDFAAMARAIAKTERTPESLAGCCVLGILSASIGAGLAVYSGPQRTTRGNVFIVVSGESGSGKSESFRHAARPFHDFEAGLLDAWLTLTLPGLQAEKEILESEIAQLKRIAGKADGALGRDKIKEKLERLKADLATTEGLIHSPVLSAEDITTEKLAVLLSKRAECLASLSPDAGAIVSNLLGRYSKLDRTDENLYLKAFSGDYCRIDRIGREPVALRAPCLTVLWLVQPDKVETLLTERSLTDGGLIPRLLLCHTNAEARPITEDAAGIPADVSEAYRQAICTLLETYRLAPEQRTIEPDAESLALLNAHYNRIVVRRRGDLRDVTTFAARWNEQAWRLAVCIHAGLHEILSSGREVERRRKRDAALSLFADKPSGITSRDVCRARIVPTSEQAHELLEAMRTEGVILGRDVATGGRPTRIYTRAAATAPLREKTKTTKSI